MLAFAPLHDAVGAAGSALSWLTNLLEPLAGGAATAAAIVVLTVAVRLLISPLTLAQVRGERRREALAPEVRDSSGGTRTTRPGCRANCSPSTGPTAPARSPAACRCCSRRRSCW
jgi:hypothetical protein